EELVQRGARDFHIIDLDGARTGNRVNTEIILKIREKVPGYMEVGGGIRREEDIRDYTSAGINGIIVGTQALENALFFANLATYNNIVLGLDVLDGKPMVRGWKSAINRDVQEILNEAKQVGIMAILCTNVAKDGMLAGPDYDGMKKMMQLTDIPLIASGGVTHIDDVKKLRDLGVWASILGKAVYEGLIKVEEAIQYAN
ncbi:MAG TPA: HisA/HisF-related TIM barrel protein, partial [Syntrophorhabdaceae bacterium]|nr:HisA/HisF-related TIM barrel protein [Syntrophorhabdaceae bacterium]